VTVSADSGSRSDTIGSLPGTYRFHRAFVDPMTTTTKREAQAFIEGFRAVPRALKDRDYARFTDPSFRDAIYAQLDATNDPADRPLIIELLRQEIGLRREERGAFDDLFCCAFLLALKRQLVDVLLLWEAKTVDFDANVGLDVQLLVFCGVDETLRFLAGQPGSGSMDAAKYIRACRAAGDFDAMDEYVAATRRYFRFAR
jgi:hypothetical protein